ncbi:hypothetical protein SAMN02745174_02457 [Cetobacterium ceti]|uniref:CS1 type fimbrial major subunit n=1 Tax=Cetobacterium ceti TaxID=180163 RepID=A0A1T4QVV0_9FUSO|nr:DUF4402 domain-containing protein [Cetobacterium ceti]SKA07448.1 hypothetical protein SAMN02745174_02457 [Cetobacterium ceti]
MKFKFKKFRNIFFICIFHLIIGIVTLASDDETNKEVKIDMKGYYLGNLNITSSGPIDFGNLAKYKPGTYKSTKITIKDTFLVNNLLETSLKVSIPDSAILTNGVTKLKVIPSFSSNIFEEIFRTNLTVNKNTVEFPIYAKINDLSRLTPGLYNGSFIVTAEYDL